MKNGDIVFFKTATSSATPKAAIAQFKGHGFGVLLGHVPPMQRDPQPDQLLALMGSIGFLSFDDIGEFLDADTQAMVIKKFEQKYYGNPTVETPPVDAPATAELPDPSITPAESV